MSMKEMIIAFRPTTTALPAKVAGECNKPPVLAPKLVSRSSISKSSLCFKSSLSCYCIKNEITDKPTEGFSALSAEIPWERGNIRSSMAVYMFNLHIPLGTGGLSIVAYLLDQPVLDPQTEVLSLLCLPDFRTRWGIASTHNDCQARI